MSTKKQVLISVKAARINAQKTQEEVADFLGLSLNGYKRKENGKRRFYIDEIVALSKLFKISIGNFFEAQCRKRTQKTITA